MFTLFTDTDMDMTSKEAEYYGYKLISMPYTINDKDVYPYIDFNEFDYKTFYQQLRDGAMPKTFGLSPEQYREYFEPSFKEGKDILYVHFSSAMSGTFNSMRLALNELKEIYPERTCYTIDTKAITLGGINILREIGDMYKDGKSIEEIMKWAEEEVDKFAVYFFTNDLTFFQRSGRVKALKAFMGNLLGIRPIINMDSEGVMKSISSAKGKKATMNKMMEYVRTLQEDIKSHRVIIGHSDDEESANQLANLIKAEFGEDIKIEFSIVNPTAGCHCGPGAVGVCFHAKHR